MHNPRGNIAPVPPLGAVRQETENKHAIAARRFLPPAQEHVFSSVVCL